MFPLKSGRPAPPTRRLLSPGAGRSSSNGSCTRSVSTSGREGARRDSDRASGGDTALHPGAGCWPGSLARSWHSQVTGTSHASGHAVGHSLPNARATGLYTLGDNALYSWQKQAQPLSPGIPVDRGPQASARSQASSLTCRRRPQTCPAPRP